MGCFEPESNCNVCYRETAQGGAQHPLDIYLINEAVTRNITALETKIELYPCLYCMALKSVFFLQLHASFI